MGGLCKLVVMKVLVILGVLCRLVCSRYILVENAGQTQSQPMQMTSQPMQMTSQPMQMTSQPMHMTSQPMHMTSQPMHMTSPPVQMTSPPMQMIQPQPMQIPTGMRAMQPISTSAYQPGFFGGEGSAQFQFGDDTVYVESVDGGGFVGFAEGDGQATFVGQGIAAGVGRGVVEVMGTGSGAVVGNGLVGFSPYPQNRYPQVVATPYRPYQQTYQPSYYPAPYYQPTQVYYY